MKMEIKTLKIKDAPKMPSHLERDIGDGYVVGIKNAYVYSPEHFHDPYGDVYIQHFTGEEEPVKRWDPVVWNIFRKTTKIEKVKDLDFYVEDVSLVYDTIEKIKLKIVHKYGKIIENRVLEEWFEPLLKQYRDYQREIKGK